MHQIITAALADLGLASKIEFVGDAPIKHGDVLCFQQYTAGDVLCAGKKVVGSAQRKYRQALMQHGSILLAQSEHAPALPGIRETAGVLLDSTEVQGAIQQNLARSTGWRIEADDWTAQESIFIQELIRAKYATATWNEKR